MKSMKPWVNKYLVPARDPVDFLERYTKPGMLERLWPNKADREECQKSRIEDAYNDLEHLGYCMLPPSSTRTGETVTWYPGWENAQIGGNDAEDKD